uniref:Uncharacterized protein n=1 Tax=Panagrolaimus davidi TaxID=227884 RepID=A0A914P300_9BILA
MRRTTKKSNVSFKCHYCGKGSDKTLVTHRTAGIASKSLERDRRLVSGNYLNRSKSVHSTYLPPLNQTSDYAYTPGKTLTEDDLREELVQIKKPITMTKSQEQLELNSLKRKIIQYERALREKTQEINNLMGDKSVFSATETKQKMQKLEDDCAKLKHRLGKSVPYVELEAERTKLAEMIETLQRENEELHHMLEGVYQENENNTLLDANGMKDPKMLSKLREEAATRMNEVEYYQRALSSLIREKSLPAIVMSPKHIKRSISVTSKNVERTISAKSERQQHLSNVATERVKMDSKKNLKPIKKTPSASLQNSTKSPNNAKYVKLESKSVARVERSEKRVKAEKNGKKILTENSVKQPVKHVNHLMNYEETESSAKSPDLLTPIESAEDEKESEKRKINHDASSITSGVTNDDDDSNIGALNAEYQEKEMEDRIGSLITALRCQLLREEMIQTRVMSF